MSVMPDLAPLCEILTKVRPEKLKAKGFSVSLFEGALPLGLRVQLRYLTIKKGQPRL